MNKNKRKFQEKEFLKRVFELLPKIFFVTLATVVVVVTTQVFKSPKVDFLNVYYEDGALNYEINIDSTDTKLVKDSLSIVLIANNERYEKEGVIGYQRDKFDVVLHRTYKLTVEGDVGLGTQVFAEKKITIKDKPSILLNAFQQIKNNIEIYFEVVNGNSISDGKVTVQVLKDLETVYFEEHEFFRGVSLTIPEISLNRDYTLRVWASKEAIFEKTIKTTKDPFISASVESHGPMIYYGFHIEDFYNRLGGKVYVEVSKDGKIVFENTHLIDTNDSWGEIFLEDKPQGIYLFKIYGFIDQKKTTLYEEHFYKIPSGEINYEFGALTCFGDVTLYDNRDNKTSYNINDYTIYLNVTNLKTSEVTKITLDESLKFSFIHDKTAIYNLDLILVWKNKEYYIGYSFIEAQVIPVEISLTSDGDYLSYFISISSLNYIGTDGIEIVFDHLISSNDQVRYYSSSEFNDSIILPLHGPYNINIYANSELIHTESYFHAPPISPYELVITSDATSLTASLHDGAIWNGVMVYLDLYLNDILVERVEGRSATFTNLISNSTYEVRVVISGDKEYTICTKEHFYTDIILEADVTVEVVSDTVYYSFTIINPIELPTNEFRVELMKDELYLESEITTEFTGSFSVYHEGDYTINVYYNNELIGSKDFYKLPTAGIYYDINSYQIHAETSLSGNISDTPEVYLDLYLDDTLIERYEGTIHGFENLVRGNTYEIRYIYVLNGVEHILANESILFHEPMGQEEIEIITADYMYNPLTFDYKLVVTYEHTMSNSDIYLIVLNWNNQDVYIGEFLLDGTPIVLDNLTKDEIFPYATVHIREADTNLATGNLTFRYEFAVVDFSIDSGVIYYNVNAYIRLINNVSREMELKHTLGETITIHPINNSMYQTTFTGEFEGGGEGINTLEYVLEGNVVGGMKKYITPTGYLDLEDDGVSLFAKVSSPNPILEPLLIRITSDYNYEEMAYEGQQLQFDNLATDTPLTVSLIATVDYNEYVVDELTYVVSTFFESFTYYEGGDRFYLTWNIGYSFASEPILKYTIYFDEGNPVEGTIDFSTIQPGTNSIEIPFTASFTTAKIVIYDITDSNNYKLIGERKAFMSV